MAQAAVIAFLAVGVDAACTINPPASSPTPLGYTGGSGVTSDVTFGAFSILDGTTPNANCGQVTYSAATITPLAPYISWIGGTNNLRVTNVPASAAGTYTVTVTATLTLAC